jgi:hypothetical protein
MKTLREITGNFKTLYINRPLLNQKDLHTWAISQGFPVTIRDMHVTIAFSKVAVDWNKITPKTDELKVLDVRDRTMKQFGEAFVMTFYSIDLERRHAEILRSGASYDFDTYIPHITISYHAPKNSINNIKPYQGPLVFGPEMLKPVDLNWKNKVKTSEV